ncbi:MAG: PTS sugar transporter subunit IIA [Desulfobacteraceae bacterium]|nr:PTS sugar transporter subunit IIA [Desulfobacteraceae bacterium]
MELGARQVAALLNISEKKLYQWISRKKIPLIRVGSQYRFNKAQLIEWAISQKIILSPAIFTDDEPDVSGIHRLDETLKRGGVFYNVKGVDIRTVLEEVISLMPLPPEIDRSYVLQVLLARETMGSTGIGNGIALPHVRNPIIMHITHPVISLCFLENPIEFNALDGKPVHTLFTIISPTPKTHLQVLSRISYALRDPGFAETIKQKADKDRIINAAATIENALGAES